MEIKKSFYKIVHFLDEIHLFEYIEYIFLLNIVFYLYCKSVLSEQVFVFVFNIIISFAFMNTWSIESKKQIKKDGK